MFEKQLSSVFEDDETKLGRLGISERVKLARHKSKRDLLSLSSVNEVPLLESVKSNRVGFDISAFSFVSVPTGQSSRCANFLFISWDQAFAKRTASALGLLRYHQQCS